MSEATTVNENKYELRALKSKDVFLMFQIIKKIGIKEFSSCMESQSVKSAISKMGDESKSGDESSEASVKAVGIAVMLDISDVIISHIPDAEQEIYKFLSSLSGLSKEDIENLGMVTFIEMIIDVFQKEEFRDFIGVVSKLFK